MVISVGVFLIQRTRCAKWRVVLGRVVRLVESDSSTPKHPELVPEIGFGVENGETIKFIAEAGPNAQVGDQLAVIYDPCNPASARLRHWRDQHPEIWLFAFGSLPFVAFGVIKVTLWLSFKLGMLGVTSPSLTFWTVL
jgi:hypothetical protein